VLGDIGKDVGQPGLRIDVVHLGADDQAVHHRGALSAPVGFGEQPGLTAKGYAAQPRSAALFVRQTRPSTRNRAKTATISRFSASGQTFRRTLFLVHEPVSGHYPGYPQP
jgi:hypothetical protein